MSGIAYIVKDGNLIQFDVYNPDRPNSPIPITGLGSGETLVGIDVRPQTGKLYGLTSSGSGVRLYLISPQTGVAVPLTSAPVQFDDGQGNPVSVQGNSFGFDFNPTVDRIRVVTSGGQNFRLNPNTGQIIDGNNGGSTPVAGVNPDGPINGATTMVEGTAYTNNAPNVSVTTQYTLDAASNSLLIQNPPNSGSQTQPRPITLQGSPLDFTAVNGFDIPAGVTVTAANQLASGQGLAALTVAGATALYAIDLTTGAAERLGDLGPGAIQGFATQSEPVPGGFPLIGLSGTQLLRFNSARLDSPTSVSITGVATGETLVGIDLRPATGQLFGLSVNPAANTATLLLLDPQTGTATPIGSAGQIALVDGAGHPVDLPETGFGIDFNPTVDRLRVVTSSGLNFRVNPITGAAIDGDRGGAAGTVAGVNPDGAIQGAATSVDATAYTNSFAQVTGRTATTQYTLDAASNSLLIQNPPNSGTQTNRLPLTLNGAALDFDAVNGFDIPAGVQVASSNTAAAGRGFAALRVNGSTGLYAIELSTGATTLLGPIAAPLSGLAVADAPAGSVAFGAPSFTASEAGPSVSINLLRQNGSSGVLTVDLSATGTATASDFSGLPKTVVFADGQTTASFSLTLTNDSLREGDETLELSLSNPLNGALAAQDKALLTITDDDPIRGTARSEQLLGTSGNDILLGLGGNDTLRGLAGQDQLTGGRGSDRQSGGAGADQFIYAGRSQRAAFAQSGLTGLDRITDFNSSQGDRIQLSFGGVGARPQRLFNAGTAQGSLATAVQAAYRDKNQRQTGDQPLAANEAVLLRLGARTYLAVNDAQAEFSGQDLLLDLAGALASIRAGSLPVSRYFV
ncbi:MAG: DUF4394 domain-containing protein [Elainella sp.]